MGTNASQIKPPGEELRRRIKRLGWSYAQAAERLGLTLDGLNKQMSGARRVSRQTEIILGYIEEKERPIVKPAQARAPRPVIGQVPVLSLKEPGVTDDEIKKFVAEHRLWSPRRLLAFVKANMEFDVEAEQRKRAEEIVAEAVRRGVLVRDDHGRITEAEDAPPDFVDPHPDRPH